MNKLRKFSQVFFKNKMTMETYFNMPFRFLDSGSYVVNERIIEVPFVFAEIVSRDGPLKVLDFGCTRSWISIALASMGYDVHGIDLREYSFAHKNFTFKKQNLLELEEDCFDTIIAVSVIEHVGLGAYGEKYCRKGLFEVLKKINSLLNKDGELIITVPVGKPFIGDFFRSFLPEEIESIVVNSGFNLIKSRYYKRLGCQQWVPCGTNEIKEVSNNIAEGRKVRSGVNGLGCLVFQKLTAQSS